MAKLVPDRDRHTHQLPIDGFSPELAPLLDALYHVECMRERLCGMPSTPRSLYACCGTAYGIVRVE